MDIVKLYKKCENKKCIICKKFIGIDEVLNNKIEYVESKRHNKFLAHKNCIGE